MRTVFLLPWIQPCQDGNRIARPTILIRISSLLRWVKYPDKFSDPFKHQLHVKSGTNRDHPEFTIRQYRARFR